MWNKLKESKGKKGISSLTMIVGVLIAFVAIGGLSDLTILQTKFSALSSQSSYVARVVARQGGLQNTRIDNYHGRYVTTQELYTNILHGMQQSGIAENEWVLKVNGEEILPHTVIPVLNYGDKARVELTIEYDWSVTSNFVPLDMTNTRTNVKNIVTTHRIRDGGFSE